MNPSKSTLAYLILFLAGAFAAARLAAFEVTTATQASDSPPLFNVLTWPLPNAAIGEPAATRFNVYRKIDPAAPYPHFPLNAAPLAVLEDCDEIQELIAKGSVDWKLIQTALASEELSLGGLTPLDLDLKKLVVGQKLLPGPIPKSPPNDACDVWKLESQGIEMAKLRLLALSRWRVAILLGQGWQDFQVLEGVTYYYKVAGIDAKGFEHTLETDISITAGSAAELAAPATIAAVAGDGKVLVHWSGVSGAVGFNVYRSTAAKGSYDLINDEGVAATLTQDLEGEPIEPDGSAVDGFVDFQRWSQQGFPVSHDVDGVDIEGPTNDTRYYYRVGGIDLLGREGPRSEAASALPEDATAPSVPREVTVVADDDKSRIEVRWARVDYDTAGHREAGISGYRVWRRSTPYSGDGALELVSPLLPQPGPGATLVRFFDVHSPANPLRPQFGEKRFWYHVECVDASDNASAKSAGIVGHLSDIAPPATPQGVAAEGFDEPIRVTWSPVSELDDEGDETISGYNVYRSLCDQGEWGCLKSPKYSDDLDRCPITFDFLGFVPQADALASGAVWEDRDVPAGSPLCYAYLVKTLDEAQNESGGKPVDPEKETIVCQRLRDKTPPGPAVITGLFARDHAVQVEWIAPPVQDLKAHHVYRSDSESGVYAWVGGLTVEAPPKLPQPLTKPYTPHTEGCEEIPLELVEGASSGSLVDSSVDPKKIYFYKVLGVDQNGNESLMAEASAMSTFTYSSKAPQAPGLAVAAVANECSLRLTWTPDFDPFADKGFSVLRSLSAAGPFVALGGSVVARSPFVDRQIESGKIYYYRVARIGLDGQVSISKAASGKKN